MKILLIKYRNIGDILLSTALISNLRFNFPNAKIDYALNKDCEEMILDNPDINQIISYDRNKVNGLSTLKKIIEELKNIIYIRKQGYDLVINLTEGERGACLALFSKAKNKLGYRIRKGIFSKLNIFDNLANDNEIQHTVEKDLQFISMLGKNPVSQKISIFWNIEIEKNIETILQENKLSEFIHIHPVSRWKFKCWEDDRMAKIIDYLSLKKKYQIVLTCSDEMHEKDRINNILGLCKSKPINLAGKMSLKHLACLSSKSKFFFGIDSAPMHIAAANEIPVISIMGASEASKWGPWVNNKDNFYSNKGVQKNSSHIVFADDDYAIFYDNGVKKCKGMVNIKAKEVIGVLNEFC